jgi:hypothetical protein
MLKFTINPTNIVFELHQHSKSYDKAKNIEIIKTINKYQVLYLEKSLKTVDELKKYEPDLLEELFASDSPLNNKCKIALDELDACSTPSVFNDNQVIEELDDNEVVEDGDLLEDLPYESSFDIPMSSYNPIMNQANPAKQITEDVLDEITKENPIALFNECSSDVCILSRHETQIRQTLELLFKSPNKNPTYTTYYPGMWFQDIVYISKLINNGMKSIKLNAIDNLYDYDECISNVNINKHANDNLVGFELNDENKRRQNYCSITTYRIIKLLELFEDYTTSITLFKNSNSYIAFCNENQANKSDVITGIDYVDDFSPPNAPKEFKDMCSRCLAKNGIVYNLYKYSRNMIHLSMTNYLYIDTGYIVKAIQAILIAFATYCVLKIDQKFGITKNIGNLTKYLFN